MWKRFKIWWDIWGETVRLQGLDDRLLADIGVERTDIRARVAGRGGATDTPDNGEAGRTCLEPAEPTLYRRRMGHEGGGL